MDSLAFLVVKLWQKW